MSKQDEPKGGIKIVCLNRKARFNYHILETFEAGLVLSGPEIKSIRKGDVSIAESFVLPYQNELYLIGAHIKPYAFSADKDYDPVRRRKLLMHRHEIDKVTGRVQEKGLTLVPLQLHFKAGRAKIELAIAKGKNAPDKRDSIKERESKREVDRAIRDKR